MTKAITVRLKKPGTWDLDKHCEVGAEYYDVLVRVEVDYEKIARQLGHKAFNSKGKKAVEAGGLVEVKVVSSEKVGAL